MNLLEVAVLSERRRDMLLLIEKKPRSLEELEGSLDISSASIKHHIKKLVISRLLVVESGKYELSEMAVPIIRNLEELLDLLTFFEKNMDYWKIHDLTPIPDFLKKRLGELGRFEFVERDSVYMFEIPGIILKSLRESKDIFTFFSCLYPEVPYVYPELAEKGLNLSLCVTEQITERLFRDSPNETKRFLEAENSKLFYCCKNVNLPLLVVTDRFMAIELFLNGGRLSNQLIICSDKRALNWGKELYRYFEELSKPLILKLGY
ncbi:MAG: helix-turn-helix transcriptional regulator [Methanosarcina sp.]|uniref:helix-turn-helix transcriptional regulator n=1 Tax=Methanosarcina sp. TaxID=2213 RepID=UPI003BB4E7A9